MNKEKELLVKKFKSFNKITLTSICREHNIRLDNLLHGTTSIEKMNIVRSELRKKILKWLSEDE